MAPSMTFNSAVVVVSKSGPEGLGGKARRRGGVADRSDRAVKDDAGLRARSSSVSSDHPPTVSPSESTSFGLLCLTGSEGIVDWAGTLNRIFRGDPLFVPLSAGLVCTFFLTLDSFGPEIWSLLTALLVDFLDLTDFGFVGMMTTGSGGSSGEMTSSSRHTSLTRSNGASLRLSCGRM